MSIFKDYYKWFKVEKETKSDSIKSFMTEYDRVLSECVDLIPLSEFANTLNDEEDGITMRRVIKCYKDMMGLCGKAFDIMIEQDERLRTIEAQNDEILKKLNEISEKKTTK